MLNLAKDHFSEANLTVNNDIEISGFDSSGLISIDQNLALYIDKVYAIPMLSLEEEMRLTRDYFENKTQASANAIVMAHLRVVVKVARKFSGYNFPMMDLICEGNYGLIKAVTKFDPNKGFRFVTYALWWIKSAIQEYVMKSWSMVKIGTSSEHRRKFFNQSAKKNDASVDNILHRDFALSGYESVDLQSDFDAHFDRKIKLNVAMDALKFLSDRERKILYMREISDDKYTLDEIGKMFNISKERVRQIYEIALKKMRSHIGK